MKPTNGCFLVVLCLAVFVLSAEGIQTVVRDKDARAVRDLSKDIASVSISRMGPDSLVFSVLFNGRPDPERLRLMLDVDPERGEASTGADYMVEGQQLFQYPQTGGGWAWNAIEPPGMVVVGNTLVYVLPAVPALSEGQWYAVTTSEEDYSAVVDRVPANGFIPYEIEMLPEYEPGIRFSPGDVSDLPEHERYSLSLRFDVQIKGTEWALVESDDAPSLFSWTPAFSTSSLPLQVLLEDMETGEKEAVVPSHVYKHENVVRAVGTNLDVAWTMLIEPVAPGQVRLTGELRSPDERCVRVAVGTGVNPLGWMWHDDVRHQRLAEEGEGVLSQTRDAARLSVYPLGVISSDRGALSVETDLTEPRVFNVVADPSDGFFGIQYDLGTTMRTSNFPGRASFACLFNSSVDSKQNAFREALAQLYTRNPGFSRSDTVPCGASAFLADISEVAGLEDFGLAYSVVGDGSIAGPKGVLEFAYMEPWIYWLPMPADMERDAASAELLMHLLAGDAGRKGEMATSALLGGVRTQDDEIAMSFVEVPWNSGAKVAVNTDPDVRPTPQLPINRAMSEWREAKRMLANEHVDGIYIDSIASSEVSDYHGAAMGVADYPCTFDSDALVPCLLNSASAWEYTSLLASALSQEGKLLIGSFAGEVSPFFAPLFDVMLAEVGWMESGQYDLSSDGDMIRRRILSGKKPFSLLLRAERDALSDVGLESYFADCLFWGFLPGVLGDADGFSYWSDKDLYERDRALFKTYMPLIRRVAAAGWDPVGFARSSKTNIWIECFGSGPERHMTLQNSDPDNSVADVKLSLGAGRAILLNPLTGHCMYSDDSSGLAVRESQVVLLDVLETNALDAELAFLAGWNTDAGAACRKTIESVKRELAIHVVCQLKYNASIVDGESNTIELSLLNEGVSPVQLSDLKLVGSVYRDHGFKDAVLSPGESTAAEFQYSTQDLAEDGWLEVQWSVEAGGEKVACARMIKSRVVPPVEVLRRQFTIRSDTRQLVTRFVILNHSEQERSASVKWDGDFGRGKETYTVAPRRAKEIDVSVPIGSVRDGWFYLTAKSGRETLFKASEDVTIDGPNNTGPHRVE